MFAADSDGDLESDQLLFNPGVPKGVAASELISL